MKAAWNLITGDDRASPDQAVRWQAYMSGATMYSVFCPRQEGQSMDDYVEEQQYARNSPGNMMEVMTRRLKTGVEIQQRETAESFSNLLWNLMGDNRRYTEKECRLHPALTHLCLTKQELDAVKGGGLLIGGGCAPEGSPWRGKRLPRWKLATECGPDGKCWGIGARADEDIGPGQLAALYVGLSATVSDGFPSSRHNVRVGDSGSKHCLGELPMAVLQELGGAGVFFNAANTRNANLVLKRLDFWESNGLLYIAMYVQEKRKISKGDFGHWDYKPFAGEGGAESYNFDDSKFLPGQPGGGASRAS
jgi:hypothetical protein